MNPREKLGCCPRSCLEERAFSGMPDDCCWRVAFVTATMGREPAVSSSPCYAAFMPAFSLQTGSPASHTVAFWILAMSMQLHWLQLSYDHVAKIGIWCRAPVGGGCSRACQLGPAAHQQRHPCWAGHHQAGEKWPACKASARPLERCRTWSNVVLGLHYSPSFCKVTGGCGHGEDFL